MDNTIWAGQLIKELIHQKVRKFVVCPGSRSTSLVCAIAEHPLAEATVHFDERGAGFYAMGLAKGLRSPVALVVTSGTALGNLMPAVMEAHHSEIPLILLTADRPPELQHCSANQTTYQNNFFTPFTRSSITVAAASKDVGLESLKSSVASAVKMATMPHMGPVQINCQFRKPFTNGTKTPAPPKGGRPKITHMPFEKTLSSEVCEKMALDLCRGEKGMIILGEMPPNSSMDPIVSLARRLQWPIISDILSNSRIHGEEKHTIPHYEGIIESVKNKGQIAPKTILHIGGSFVSAPLLELFRSHPPELYLQVDTKQERFDPGHLVTHRLVFDPNQFAQALLPHLRGESPSDFFKLWTTLGSEASLRLKKYFEKSQDLGEMEMVRELLNYVTPSTALFLSNSMPIRDANNYFYPKKGSGPIYGNRGLSGVDGNIATAVGVAEALSKPLVALFGDQAFLHDMNSLALIKKTLPLKMVVVNNGGGGIFSFLPIRDQRNVFESFFAAAHAMSLEAIAEQFGLQYFQPKNIAEFNKTLRFESPTDAPSLIEIHTDREANYKAHQSLLNSLKGLDKKVSLSSPKRAALYSYQGS